MAVQRGLAWSSATTVTIADVRRTDRHLDFLADPPHR